MKIYTYVGDLTGVYCDLYRFPGGSMNLSGRACFMADEIRTFLSQMYCVYFDWNVTNGDGEDVTADLAYQNVMNEIEGQQHSRHPHARWREKRVYCGIPPANPRHFNCAGIFL